MKKSLITMLILGTSLSQAAVPKFSIVPTADSITNLLLPSNFTETVMYQVTNNTKITRTLTMVPIQGVTQTLSGNVCSNPFTLASGESCLLSLVINGSQVSSSGIMGGPVICKTKGTNDDSPDPFLCSQPKKGDLLAISITSAGQHAYIANQSGSSVSVCQVNPSTGFLSQCAVEGTGLTSIEAVAFNPAGTLLYTANLGSNSVSMCQLDQATGSLSNCTDAGGSGFNQPDGIAFNPDGSILYASNVAGPVTACSVNPDGTLSACSSNLLPAGSSDLALNAAGTLAYVPNRFNSVVSVCNVNGKTVDSCNDLSGSLIDGPEGITLSGSGLHAYVANAGNNEVVVCDIRQDGTGLLKNCSVTNGQFQGTGNLGLDASSLFAYVPNKVLNQVFVCTISPTDGTLSGCLPSRGTGFDGPAGIVVQ